MQDIIKKRLIDHQAFWQPIVDSHTLLFETKLAVSAHKSKKNGKTIRGGRFNKSQPWKRGRIFISSNDDVIKAEQYMVSRLSARTTDVRYPLPVIDSVWAMFLFFYPASEFYTKKGLENKTLPDLSNLYELPQDALQKAGIIENDRLIKSHSGSQILPHLEAECMIHIRLMKFTGV